METLKNRVPTCLGHLASFNILFSADVGLTLACPSSPRQHPRGARQGPPAGEGGEQAGRRLAASPKGRAQAGTPLQAKPGGCSPFMRMHPPAFGDLEILRFTTQYIVKLTNYY